MLQFVYHLEQTNLKMLFKWFKLHFPEHAQTLKDIFLLQMHLIKNKPTFQMFKVAFHL